MYKKNLFISLHAPKKWKRSSAMHQSTKLKYQPEDMHNNELSFVIHERQVRYGPIAAEIAKMRLLAFKRFMQPKNLRFYTQTTTPPSAKPTAPPPAKTDVPGLSSNIVRPAKGPVGPGASPTAEYKVPEYFCYNRMSYHEAEVELAKHRCPQPSALKK